MEGLPEEEEEHTEKDKEGKEKEHKEADGGKILDPHVWLDPVLAQKEVEVHCNGFNASRSCA